MSHDHHATSETEDVSDSGLDYVSCDTGESRDAAVKGATPITATHEKNVRRASCESEQLRRDSRMEVSSRRIRAIRERCALNVVTKFSKGTRPPRDESRDSHVRSKARSKGLPVLDFASKLWDT